jgi:oxygen-dependent protoporphyrinogen oxidase
MSKPGAEAGAVSDQGGMPTSVDVLIVGAGVAGLTAAIRMEDAVRSGAIQSYFIADAADQVGGVIRTVEEDGYLLESGPDMFFAEKPEVTEMAGRLGLGRELIHTNPKMRRSFLAVKGRLRPMPPGFFLTAPSQLRPFFMSGIIGPLAKLRMVLEPFIPAKKTTEDESVASFVRRRFGRSALKRIAQPMIGGIYAGDPEKLSARWAMPKFVEWERRCGSVVWGLKTKGSDTAAGPGTAGPRYSLFQSFRKGMAVLPRAMAAAIPQERLQLGTEVTQLKRVEGGWSARIGGHEMRCRTLILAVPAAAAAKLLRAEAPRVAELLDKLRYESCAIVQTAWNRSDIGHPLDGLGFVVPAEDGLPIMAGSFSSIKFEGRAPEGKVMIRFFAGGAFGQKLLALPEQELWPAIKPHAYKLLGIKPETEPIFTKVLYYRESMPQYEVGHDDWAASLKAACAAYPGLNVCGAMMQGVGIPDAIRDGAHAADFVLEQLKGRSTDLKTTSQERLL